MFYAGSGLPRENNLFPPKVGLRLVFVDLLIWVQKWVKSGFLGSKVGQTVSKPTFFTHFKPTLGYWQKPILLTHFKGGGRSCLQKKAVRLSRPSVTAVGLCAPFDCRGMNLLMATLTLTLFDGFKLIFPVVMRSGGNYTFLGGVIRANLFARFAWIKWFGRIGNSSHLCESAWRAIKIGVSTIANDSRESRCESPVPLRHLLTYTSRNDTYTS